MSENADILDMADSDIENMSQEEARVVIDRTMRAGPAHPYFSNADLKAHRVAGEKMTKLYQVASPEPEAQVNAAGEEVADPFPPAVVAAMKEGLEIQREKQAKLVAEAQREMDVLVNEFGYKESDIPDDIQSWQVSLLRAQRLNKQKPTPDTLRELNEILEKESHGVKFDPELSAAISHLSQARLTLGKNNPEEFAEIAEGVIHLINKAHDKQKAKGKKHGD